RHGRAGGRAPVRGERPDDRVQPGGSGGGGPRDRILNTRGGRLRPSLLQRLLYRAPISTGFPGGDMKEIWVEKYRPTKLDEIVGQDEIVSRLKAYVRAGNLPHLLFAGPAGTGKTTSAIALARELFGEDWRTNFAELNASDERGLEVVRVKIKDMARTAPIGERGFKIIFLDEADNLTSDAQAALRRTMETYTRTARFVMSCNYSSRIIEAIQSRTAVFRFRPLKPDAIRTYLERIAKSEKRKRTKQGTGAGGCV